MNPEEVFMLFVTAINRHDKSSPPTHTGVRLSAPILVDIFSTAVQTDGGLL